MLFFSQTPQKGLENLKIFNDFDFLSKKSAPPKSQFGNIPLVLKACLGERPRGNRNATACPRTFFAYKTRAFLMVLASLGPPPAISEGGIVDFRQVL